MEETSITKGEKPYIANGTTSDPREQKMWDIYVSKLAKGYENAYESAIEAGYSNDHSRNITMQGWFKERADKLRRKEMLSLAEKNLKKGMEAHYLDNDGNIRADVMRIVMDVSKTIATTLGKEAYASRTEQTGKDGGAIEFKPITGMQIIKENE